MSAQWIGFKRWRLRAGADEAALVTLVREEVVPHYRTLDPHATLGLLRSPTPGEYVATQQWPSSEYRERVCSGSRFTEWFTEYEPILVRFDALVQFVDEWDGTELLEPSVH